MKVKHDKYDFLLDATVAQEWRVNPLMVIIIVVRRAIRRYRTQWKVIFEQDIEFFYENLELTKQPKIQLFYI